MLKSIYTPMSGALAQERVLEVIANNLANVNTVGFKGDRVTFALQDAEPEKNYQSPIPTANYKVDVADLLHLKGNDITYAGVAEVKRDESQGSAMQTGNPLDVMIEGQGMLQVQTPDGTRFTRNGSLSLSSDGILMTRGGHPVMGDKGDILVRGGAFEINSSGEVWQDGNMIDRIKLVTFDESAELERTGGNLFFHGGEESGQRPVVDPQMKQGWLEGSNVNAIKNLTSMIVAHRSYEAYQKAISNYDRIMEKSSNAIGDVRA